MLKSLLILTTMFFLNNASAQKRDSAYREKQKTLKAIYDSLDHEFYFWSQMYKFNYPKIIKDSTNQEYWFNYLYDSSENLLAYHCGNGGSKTNINTYFMCHLINAGRYDLITKLLGSPLSSTRYLAAISLLFADEKSIFKLDSVTFANIEALREDKTTIPECGGCVVFSMSFSSLPVKNPKKSIRKRRKTFNWVESFLYNSAESVF